MKLDEYIQEAVSHGRRSVRTLKEPIQKDDLIFWLKMNGYTGNWDFLDRTDEALKRKSKMYCEITYCDIPVPNKSNKSTSIVLYITNGDGENEYRLLFDKNKGYELTSMAIVRVLYGRMDIFNVLCDSEGIAVLKDWLTGAVREAVSVGLPAGRMTDLKTYLTERLSDVKAKWHPEEGLFTRKDPNYIANYLIKNSKDLKQAMSRLTFYMNRAGDNLSNKSTLEKAKKIIHSKTENE